MTFVQRLCLTFARVALSAWVGGATLFVINAVRLNSSDTFDSLARDHLSLIRFPAYYLFGFTLVGGSLVALLMAKGFPRKLAMGLIIVAISFMLADYFAVYRPLEAMITPPGQPRPPHFEGYHRASMIINAVHVGLCLLAAIVINRPMSPSSEGDF